MTTPSSFITFIHTITKVSSELARRFDELVRIVEVPKGDRFIRAGQYPKAVAFVRQGLFRYYYTNQQGVQYTKAFFPENSILGAYSAILEKRPSYFTIEALEDSVIEKVDYLKFEELFSGSPCWNAFLVAVLQKGYVMKEAREREFLVCSAEERYLLFLERYPGLEHRIRQHIVASYLGIAPESLSRIRRNIGSLT